MVCLPRAWKKKVCNMVRSIFERVADIGVDIRLVERGSSGVRRTSRRASGTWKAFHSRAISQTFYYRHFQSGERWEYHHKGRGKRC
jgi:hypothetical protein